jgi:hypothetical protein
VIIDQSLQPPAIIPGESYHYDAAGSSLIAPIGQEFTPSLNGLDFVDVKFLSQLGTNSGDGTFQIAIHQGTITAPVLALSGQMTFSSGINGTDAQFTFPSTVPLAPGNTYVLEVLQIAGNALWGVEVPLSAVVNGQTIDMNYPGGRMIFAGVPRDTNDMIFAEGIFVPEPSVSFLLLAGVLVFGLGRRASSKSRREAPTVLRVAKG